MDKQIYYRGQIYYVHREGTVGREQGGCRPAVIVSNNLNNKYSAVVEVVFLTTKKKTDLPTHVRIDSAPLPSTALCEQIASVDKRRIREYVSNVSQQEMAAIEKAMLVSLGIDMGLRHEPVS